MVSPNTPAALNQRKTIALVFGGRSPEHAISIRSARNIAAAIPRDAYELKLVGIDPGGRWYHLPEAILQADAFEFAEGQPLALMPGASNPMVYATDSSPFEVELVFPIVHGPNGEDGTLQGLLRQLNLPFVGPDVLASAAAMDKDVCKRLLEEAGQLVAEGLVYRRHERDSINPAAVFNRLGSPVFVKPANMGSSVGVSKVVKPSELLKSVDEAFRYDTKILIEEMIDGRELECAVLGNAIPKTTGVGEVVKHEQFYDYASKYLNDTGAAVVVPAEGIEERVLAKLKYCAQQAFRTLECAGLARVDMFLTENNLVYINEVNTLPGFTDISMYPQLWAAEGLSYGELIRQLIELGFERAEQMAQLEQGL